MALDLGILMPWITAALSIIAFLTAIKNILGSPVKENADKLAKLESKLVEHDRRIQTVEGEIKHLPTREAQHQIEIGLEKINGRLDTLAESLKPIRANGEMLNDLLREQVKAATK